MRKSLFILLWEILILAIFGAFIYYLGPLALIGYALTIYVVIKKKLYKKKRMAKYVIYGTLTGIVAAYITLIALDNVLAKNITGAIIFILVAGYLHYRSHRWKRVRR